MNNRETVARMTKYYSHQLKFNQYEINFQKLFLSVLFCTASEAIVYCQLYEWRGPGRSGIYNESGLLKKWPDGGPALLWEAENMGDGYSSPTVTDDAVYVTGRKDSSDVLTALTLWMEKRNGKQCMEKPG